MSSLLSLIPPSYIVVPKKDLENIFSSTLAISSTTKQITYLLAPRVMDIDIFTINNYNDVRRITISPSKANLRIASMSSSILSELYHEKIEYFNNLSNEFRKPVNSSQLSYDNNRREENQISKATD